MKWFAASLLALTMTAHSDTVRFYLGTSTGKSGSKGIYSATLDPGTGKLGEPELAAEAANPTFVAVAPGGRTVYAALEADGGAVGAYRVEESGSLTALNTVPSGGDGACHVSTDHSGRHALVANYGGGSAAVIALRPDGSLGNQTAFVQFSGSGPHPKRQQKSYGHGIIADSSDRTVYVNDLGADRVWSFRFDSAAGTLVATDPPAGVVPPGGGPRHLALHPNGKFAYANNEMGLSVTGFTRDADTGVLTPLGTWPTSESLTGPVEGVTTSEIICHPNGRWLYVSSRGDNTLAAFRIGDDGVLERIQSVPAEVEIPRGMALDPSGRWLVVAGQKDHRLTAFSVDPTSGTLTPTGQFVSVPAPVCVAFVPAR